MRNLLLFLLLSVFVLCGPSCAQRDQGSAGGSSTTGSPTTTSQAGDSREPLTPEEKERKALRKFGREWQDRYSEKSLQRRYGLSKRQLEAAKKEMKKQDPSLATKARQDPSGAPGYSPATGQASGPASRPTSSE